MVILDTNVVSELMMSSPNPGVLEWLETRQPADLFISAISEAELRFGAEILPPGRRRESLLADIDRMLTTNFPDRVLPFDQDAARAYASIPPRAGELGGLLPTRTAKLPRSPGRWERQSQPEMQAGSRNAGSKSLILGLPNKKRSFP